MKFTKFVGAALVFLAMSASAAQADSPIQSRMASIRAMALRCSVQPYRVAPNGVISNAPIRSVCPELQILGTTAVFHFPAGTLQIAVRDSANSDGGDLVTVLLTDEHGRSGVVADDVLAYGDPILAVLGQNAARLPRVAE